MSAISKVGCKLSVAFVVSALATLICPPLVSATAILGSAQSFAVLGHETVTNGHSALNPTTQVYGNLGVVNRRGILTQHRRPTLTHLMVSGS